MELDMQIGDRVTYKNNMNDIRQVIIKDEEQKNKYCNNKTAFEILKIERSQYEETYKKGIITHHVTIETEKLKQLILENNNYYRNLSLKTKITLVKQYTEFDNDTDLLEFLSLWRNSMYAEWMKNISLKVTEEDIKQWKEKQKKKRINMVATSVSVTSNKSSVK